MDKKGQFNIATSAIWGVVGFLLAVIVGLIIVTTLSGAGFFTAGTAAAGAVGNISSNLTSGVNTVTSYIPTIFTVVAIAIVLAILGLLVLVVRKYGMGGSNSFGQ